MNTITPAKTALYDLLKDAGCELDSHQSDLYVLATPKAREIVAAYEAEGHITNRSPFRSTDGRLWLELPFHNKPYWEAKLGGEAEQETAAPAI